MDNGGILKFEKLPTRIQFRIQKF